MSGHTPGPWEITYGASDHEPKKDNAPFYIITDTMILAEVIDWESKYPGIGSANARLIAAAPRLVEALRPFAEMAGVLGAGWLTRGPGADGEEHEITSEDIVRAAEAIAKAEGTS